MATYRKRGDKWRAEVRIRGQAFSASFGTRTAARKWAEEQEDQIRSGVSRNGDTLREVFARYSREVTPGKRGEKWETVRLGLFARIMPFVDRAAAEVTPDDIGRWRDARLKSVKPGTVLRELNLLAAVYEAARREWRLVPANPVRDVRKPSAPPPRDTRISDDDANLIFALAGYQRGAPAANQLQIAAAAFDFAIATAMRAGEIRAIRGEGVHLVDRYLHVPTSKTGAARDVPLSSAAVEILQGLDRDQPFPITAAMLDNRFRQLRDKAGLACTFHDARHEAITRLSRKLDVRDLARMTGHKDLKMLLRYYNPTAKELASRLD